MSDKTDIKSMTLPELEVFTTEVMGEKKFRAKQIYEWMHVRLADSFDEMTNLSKDLRQKLSEQCVLSHLEMVEKYVSAIDGTAKYLFKLSDDRIIESVLMHYKHGNSVFLHRLDVGWGAVSAHRHWAALNGRCWHRKCWMKFIRSRRIPVNVYQMWLLWEQGNRWTISMPLCG